VPPGPGASAPERLPKSGGGGVQRPGSGEGAMGWKRLGATAASPTSASASTRANGTVRPSRAARVFVRLMRMRKIQVFSDERRSNAQMPCITPSQVPWTTSSAMARSEM